MHFEWDRSKVEANRTRHHVTFDEAIGVFFDALSATFPDTDSGPGEERLITIGQSSLLRLLVVVHTELGETIRIISAWLATAHKRKRHET